MEAANWSHFAEVLLKQQQPSFNQLRLDEGVKNEAQSEISAADGGAIFLVTQPSTYRGAKKPII